MDKDLIPFKEWFQKHQESIAKDFFSFLRFKSISADPAYSAQMRACVEWLKGYLQRLNLDVQIWESPSYPVIFASHEKAGKDRPTLLIYHHYDVQPVDPIELWESGPFDPAMRGGNVYARGASDNKGQCFYTITAIKAFLQLSERLDFNLKLCIEGEEESGSKGLNALLDDKKEALKADFLLVVDAGIPGRDTPAVTLGTRGIVTFHVQCKGSAIDLHSGVHGGIALNPNRALANLLSKLWDREGKVAVPGFYEDLQPMKEQDVKALDLDFDREEYVKLFGVTAFNGEKGLSVRESNWLRPTVEINGIQGGYTGPGFKTVIPAVAVANLSCRLVPDQQPEKIAGLVADFLQRNKEEGIELTVEIGHGGKPLWVSAESKIAKLVAAAYLDVYGKKCEFHLMGGSIPITVDLAHASGAETLFIGTSLDDDNFHAPNEKFGWDCFEQGFLTMIRIFQRMANET